MSELQKEWPGTSPAEHTTDLPTANGGREVVAGVRPLPANSLSGRWARALPVGLYLLSAVLLLFRLDSHPGFTYNWENNTADGLFAFMDGTGPNIFHIKEGLMTDSGTSPLIVLPAWFGFFVGGVSLVSMRWPVALIAAGAVPMLWFVGKRLVGKWQGLLAALLLALSPAFLVYARTATDVAVSLVPMLLTVYVLLRLLERPERWWWALALQGTLLLGAYGYAPIRFLWLFSVALLAFEAFRMKAQRKRLLLAAGLTVVVMAGTITALDYDHGHDFITSVGYYYSGRGEQVANLLTSEQDYARTVGRSNDQIPSTFEFLAQVIGQNSADLANLLLDRDTEPAFTDYWNPQGRLIPLLLVPFFLLGFGRVVWLARRRDAYRYHLLVLFFLGFTLPMVLTSRVHIGRLIFALPLLFLIVAVGIADWGLRIADWLLQRARMNASVRRYVMAACVVVLVAGVALSAWDDYTTDIPATRDYRITQQLIGDVGAVRADGGSVALIAESDPTLILESIDSNQVRLGLQAYYCYFNLTTGQGTPCPKSEGRPVLFVGNILARLQDPSAVPGYCTDIYYVSSNLLDQFQRAARAHASICTQPLKYKLLPD